MLYRHQTTVNNGLVGDVCTVESFKQPMVRRPFRVAQECREASCGHAEQFARFREREEISIIHKSIVIIGLGFGFGQFRLEGFGSGQ